MIEPTSEPAAAPGRILVATDFSETAAAALEWATEIATSRGAQLFLAHVVALPSPPPDYLPSPPDFSQQVEGAALSRLDEVAQHARNRGTRVETMLLNGIPSQAILGAVGEIEPDLIVVGTQGLSHSNSLLFGSTAERIVQRAECPVLSVHPGDAGGGRSISTILVPTDFSEHAEIAVVTAQRLLAPLESDAGLVLVHAFHLPIEYTAYGPIPTSVNYLRDTGGEALAHLEAQAAELSAQGLEVETVSREGYAPDIILEEAERTGADIIVMGTRGRSGLAHLLLGSTTVRVVQEAPCPVMTVRQTDDES